MSLIYAYIIISWVFIYSKREGIIDSVREYDVGYIISNRLYYILMFSLAPLLMTVHLVGKLIKLFDKM